MKTHTIYERAGYSIVQKGEEFILSSDSGEDMSLGSMGIEGVRAEIESLLAFAEGFTHEDEIGKMV